MATYPRWSYFPSQPPCPGLGRAVRGGRRCGRERHFDSGRTRPQQRWGAPEDRRGLGRLGFQVERSKAASDKIARAVLFGDEDLPSVTMQIDAFQDRDGIALEVEAGRAWHGNAVYRDLIRISLLLDANYLAMLLPFGYRPRSAKSPVPAYAYSRDLLDAIYASQRLRLPFEGVLARRLLT